MATQASAGRALVDRIVGDLKAQGLEPDSKDAELLDVASDIVDRITVLEAAIAAQGLTVVLDDGRIQLHPAICEVRQQRIILLKTLGMISTEPPGTKNPAKQRAAEAMWRTRRTGA